MAPPQGRFSAAAPCEPPRGVSILSFQKAQRQQAQLRLALWGPSGSGKTSSALLVAQGLAPDGRIARIDTERGSGERYCHIADDDAATLAPRSLRSGTSNGSGKRSKPVTRC